MIARMLTRLFGALAAEDPDQCPRCGERVNPCRLRTTGETWRACFQCGWDSRPGKSAVESERDLMKFLEENSS